MKIRKLSFGVALMLLMASTARADLVVTVGDVNLAAGSSGYVPVFISSNDGDQVALTSFQFLITTGGATRLDFTNSPAPGSDPTYTNSNYIFFGNSGNVAAPSNLGNASQTTVPNDTFNGGDSTNDSSNVTVTSNGTMLLADLPVTTLLTGLPPAAGDTFSISLVPASGTGSDFTFFTDNSFENNIPFTSNSGTVTITPAIAVPLPKPLMALLVLLGMLAIVSRFHRRAASNQN